MVRALLLGRDSAQEGRDHDNSTAVSRRGFCALVRARLRRRLGATLVPLMLTAPGGPTPLVDPAAPHVTSAAESDCLSLQPGGPGQAIAFSPEQKSAGSCTTTALPLLDKTPLGLGTVSGDLEFSNMDFSQMTANEVALKFGLGRDLPLLGVHANLDGSVGRVLGNLAPVLDEQLHATFSRSLIAHWDTGFETRLGWLSVLGPVQPTERSGLLFLRGRYELFSNQWEQQTLELKFSADSLESTMQTPSRHARADLRYEYHRDSNVLSIGLNAMDTQEAIGPTGPSVGLDIRASRQF
jgi:hypothetical protein